MAGEDVPLGRHLKELGLSSQNPLTEKTLRAAYHVKAKKHHPDRAGPKSHEAFVKLQAAYEAALSFCTGLKTSSGSKAPVETSTSTTHAAPVSSTEDTPPPGVTKQEWRRAREIWEKPSTPCTKFKPGTPGSILKPSTPGSPSKNTPRPPPSPLRPPQFEKKPSA